MIKHIKENKGLPAVGYRSQNLHAISLFLHGLVDWLYETSFKRAPQRAILNPFSRERFQIIDAADTGGLDKMVLLPVNGDPSIVNMRRAAAVIAAMAPNP